MKNPKINKKDLIESELMEKLAMDFAEYERKVIGKRIKMGLLHKANQGEYPHRASIGYKNSFDDNGKRKLKIDNRIAPFIQDAFNLRANGLKVREITEKLYSKGFRNKNGNKVTTKRLKHILQDPIYIGKFNYQGKMFTGIHKPIISEELFSKVQLLL